MLTKHGHSPAPRRSQARGGEKGHTEAAEGLSELRRGERDRLEMIGFIGDIMRGGEGDAGGVGVN